MARQRSKVSSGAASCATSQDASSAHAAGKAAGKHDKHGIRPKTPSHLFSHIADATAHFAGQPLAFLIAVAVVVIWALTGPLFGFSDTWQLVINTSTTIVTFLMVFLLQHTQNRDSLAVQLKLAALIIAVRQAGNRLATIEDLSEEELEELHEEYRARAEEALHHLHRRRAQIKHAS